MPQDMYHLPKLTLLFTASDTLVGKAIRFLTNEPMSHVALRAGNVVLHSSVVGVEAVSYEHFAHKYNVIAEIPTVPQPPVHPMLYLVEQKDKYDASFYDYGCLLYLGVRYVIKKYMGISIPKVNLWAVSGMVTCTEFVTHVLDGKQDSLVTPYQLYLRYSQKGTSNG